MTTIYPLEAKTYYVAPMSSIPNRDEFYRDIESVKRLSLASTEDEKNNFLESICLRRAWFEIREEYYHRPVTLFELKNRQDQRYKELISACKSLGYYTREKSQIETGEFL